jgi:hypothetical protein
MTRGFTSDLGGLDMAARLKQFLVTPSMGKRLIGKGMVIHPDIQRVLSKGTLVIIAGTTNGYAAEEILRSLNQAEDFSRVGFRRGMSAARGATVSKAELKGDIVIRDGVWSKGKTIFDVADELNASDVILKGGNAFDSHRRAAVLAASPQGGTIMAAHTAVVGRRTRLLVPIGLEKRVFEDVALLAERSYLPNAEGLRLIPILGEIFTELDAVKLLTGADACLLAAGGVYGAEGAVWLGISGTDSQLQKAVSLFEEISDEPPCCV